MCVHWLECGTQQRNSFFFTQIMYVYRITRKFDGELNLAVGVETTKLKSANIIFACDA